MDKYAITEIKKKHKGKKYTFPLGAKAENIETNQLRQFVSAEEKEKIGEIDSIKQSFTDGCNTIVAGCTTYGAAPASNSPSDIVDAIGLIYQRRYDAGYADGIQQGHEDVVNDPAGYGIQVGTPVMFAVSSYPECIASPATVLPAGTYRCVALLFCGTQFSSPQTAVVGVEDGTLGWNAGTLSPEDHDYNAWADVRTHDFTLDEPAAMRCYVAPSTSAASSAASIAVYKIA